MVMAKYTLNNVIPTETLSSLEELYKRNNNHDCIVVGGFAVQMYSPYRSLLRGTNDLDIILPKIISNEEFKNGIGSSLKEILEEKGFNARLRKGHRAYEVDLEEAEGNFCIHLSRFSPSYWKRSKDWKQREAKNAIRKTIKDIDTSLLVHRLEDVLANKARRLRKLDSEGYITGKNRNYWSNLQNYEFNKLAENDLEGKLNHIELLKNQIPTVVNRKNKEAYDTLKDYKVEKDIYDVSLLSRAIVEGYETIEKEYLDIGMNTGN